MLAENELSNDADSRADQLFKQSQAEMLLLFEYLVVGKLGVFLNPDQVCFSSQENWTIKILVYLIFSGLWNYFVTILSKEILKFSKSAEELLNLV